MRIFPRQNQIGENEGFTPENDIFGRRELGEGLTNLVSMVTDPMVLAIDGQWGSGKTTFLKMWAGHLRNQDFPVIYFDAFENDYVDDAFAALAAEIIALVDSERKSEDPKAKEFKAKAVGALKVLGRSALKIGVKAASMGALDATKLGDDIAEAISDEAEELADKHIGDLLTKQAEHRSTLQAFRDALRDLPGILAPPPEEQEGEMPKQAKPLIFMIDELDRCKPVFALALLERIKHFFAVPNVHFVLGTHMGQLRNSLNAAYGQNMDANTYLQKFVSLTFLLSNDSEHRHEMPSSKYISKIRRELNIKPDDNSLIGHAEKFISVYAILNDISLRDIEFIMANIALSIAFTNREDLRPSSLIAGLAILRVAHPEIYAQAKRGTLRYEDVVKFLSLNSTAKLSNEEISYPQHDRDIWEYATKIDISDSILLKFENVFSHQFNIDRLSIVKYLTNSVVDRLVIT